LDASARGGGGGGFDAGTNVTGNVCGDGRGGGAPITNGGPVGVERRVRSLSSGFAAFAGTFSLPDACKLLLRPASLRSRSMALATSWLSRSGAVDAVQLLLRGPTSQAVDSASVGVGGDDIAATMVVASLAGV